MTAVNMRRIVYWFRPQCYRCLYRNKVGENPIESYLLYLKDELGTCQGCNKPLRKEEYDETLIEPTPEFIKAKEEFKLKRTP